MEVVGKIGFFERVAPVDLPAGGSTEKEYLEQAWRNRDDLIMFVKLRRFENSYEGSNGWFLPNLLLWATFVWPAWWVADEQYGAAVDMEIRLVSVHSQKEVARTTLSSSEIRDLDDFDRGWHPLGILRVPGSLDPENWEKVSDVVSKYPLARVKIDLAKYFHQKFRKRVGEPSFSKAVAKTVGLFIGISKYDSYKRHNIRFAAKDARKVYDLMVGDEPGQVPGKNAVLLVDQQATAENIKKAIDGFIFERARKDDTVVIFFAGYGAVGLDGKGAMEAFLVPYDYDHRTKLADKGISLSYLRDAFEKCAATNIAVFVDASFSGIEGDSDSETGSRSFSEVPSPQARSSMDGIFRNRTGAALVGAGPDQKALEFEDVEMGLFSYYLVEGLGGKADGDKDGSITVSELDRYTAENLKTKAGLMGETQKPALIDNKGAAMVVRSIAPAGGGKETK
jgi:hypothetical protein